MIADEAKKASRLLHANALIDAIECDDGPAEARALQALNSEHETALYSDLNRIADELRRTLSKVPVNSELSRLAHTDLPDAQVRLNRVLELTEEAANTSLEAVERALPAIKKLAADVKTFDGRWRSCGLAPPERKAILAQLLDGILEEAGVIEACLSDVLLAQGFQDLTGQIIRRVVQLVAELERLLPSSAFAESCASEPNQHRDALSRGTGPAVPGLADVSTLNGQEDVDDLLGRLGL